ncbi:MAG: hypothetical protein ACO3JL_18965, partial [Myxococcota bacterium]
MMRRRSRTAPLVACFCLFAACDPARVVTETDLFPELRRRLLEDCCRCLAGSQVPTQAASCTPDEYGTGEERGDAEGVKTVTCLCDVDVESCTEALWA